MMSTSRVDIKFQQTSGVKSQEKDPNQIRKVYDNIHGFIYLPQKVWSFVDTPHFQRLRHIKQLGCLEYVFPGATHTRFEHSLGTAHLAQTFIKKLMENNPKSYEENEKQSAILTVTLAGLLHDLGHGPYSHTFDSHIVTKITKQGEQEPTKWTHQMASDALFLHLVQKEEQCRYLSKKQVQRVRALIKGQVDGQRNWQFQLISNKKSGIDVDKLDYFRRDAFHLGAKNIYVDHQLLMNQARIIDNEICYPTKYVQTVYNIFHCRYKLYKNYYFNLISKGIELMICDILSQINAKFNFRAICQKIFSDPRGYIKLTDSIIERVEDIYSEIEGNKDSPDSKYLQNFKKAVDIIQRIKKRKIYKFVKEFHYFIQEGTDKKILQNFKEQFEGKKVEMAISKDAGIDVDRICLAISEIGFGLKDSNPLNRVGFFKKEVKPHRKLDAKEIPYLSMLYTPTYLERSVKIFIKDDDTDAFTRVEQAFTKYCKDINKQCQETFKKQGLHVIFEGRGGNTPSVSVPQQNQADSKKHKVAIPVIKGEDDD